jgi:hypothetical protein
MSGRDSVTTARQWAGSVSRAGDETWTNTAPPDALDDRIQRLEERLTMLGREIDRTVQLVESYGETLGRHLKLVLADHRALATRIEAIERGLFRTD